MPRSDKEAESKITFAPTIPDLVVREIVASLVLIAFILVISALFNAPLAEMANPGMSPNPAKAPWYFLGIQELLFHFHPFFAVVIIPVVVLASLIYLPYKHFDSYTPGVWFISDKGKKLGLYTAVFSLLFITAFIGVDEYVIATSGWMPNVPAFVSNGLIPFLVLAAAITTVLLFLKKKFSATTEETVQSVFVFLLVTIVILTITALWFRGESMRLMWPWNVGS